MLHIKLVADVLLMYVVLLQIYKVSKLQEMSAKESQDKWNKGTAIRDSPSNNVCSDKIQGVGCRYLNVLAVHGGLALACEG